MSDLLTKAHLRRFIWQTTLSYAIIMTLAGAVLVAVLS